MALFLELPAEAKNKKSEIYTVYYDKVFDSQINAIKLLVSFKLLEWFRQVLKNERNNLTSDEWSLFSNALLHFLPLFNLWILEPANIILRDIVVKDDALKLIKKEFDKSHKRLLDLLGAAMARHRKDPSFNNYQYFFKSTTALSKLLKSISQETLDYKAELDKESYNKAGDLRYTKPERYTLDGKKFYDGGTWSELFITLMELYSKTFVLKEGNLPFIDTGSRALLLKGVSSASEEAKLRKKIKDDFWLLTNFDSKRLCEFCFAVAKELDLDLKIKLRPTKFRLENKLT